MTFDEALRILRADHRIDIYPGPPATWWCSCGKHSRGGGVVGLTENRARASADRHLRSTLDKIIVQEAAEAP